MEQASVKIENDLNRNTRDAKTIFLLSLISVVAPPLFLVALVFFIIYFNKLKKLKNDQSLSSIFNELKKNRKKELRPISRDSKSLEKSIAASILEHKKTVAVLIIIGIVLTIMIAYIGLAYRMGWV